MVVSPNSFATWSLTPTLSRAIRIFSLLGAATYLYLSNWRTLSTVFFTVAVHDWVFFLALATRLVNKSSQHFTLICGGLALLMAGGFVFRPVASFCVVLFAVASFLAKSYFEMWIVCCGAAGVLLLGFSVAFAPGGAPGMAAAATFLWCNIWQLLSRFLISNLLMPSVTFSKVRQLRGSTVNGLKQVVRRRLEQLNGCTQAGYGGIALVHGRSSHKNDPVAQ
ncbi:hypothetical protein CYMTET_45407 [Cymbomonas tetramitiformis]|uniref:Transmembrane protein n=1 Tax=Cymbomonas tetramitiformis TaxID=36881 RepID=A0AAE0EYL9_9CHLO|nr:hypothetical protein CYMTET_45407 [Cymbomonas tetramitiformis]